MRDVKSALSRVEPMIIRIDATLTSILPHLATREELSATKSELRTEISSIRVDMSGLRAEMHERLRELPNKTDIWSILGVLVAARGSGLAALVILKEPRPRHRSPAPALTSC